MIGEQCRGYLGRQTLLTSFSAVFNTGDHRPDINFSKIPSKKKNSLT